YTAKRRRPRRVGFAQFQAVSPFLPCPGASILDGAHYRLDVFAYPTEEIQVVGAPMSKQESEPAPSDEPDAGRHALRGEHDRFEPAIEAARLVHSPTPACAPASGSTHPATGRRATFRTPSLRSPTTAPRSAPPPPPTPSVSPPPSCRSSSSPSP